MKGGLQVDIRFMKTEDIAGVAALEKEIFSDPWSRESFSSSLKQDYSIYLCAFTDDQLAGYCGLIMAGDEADIVNVAVRDSFRGRGIAGKMLTCLMDLAGQRGIRRFLLEVRSGNDPALSLYRRLGFEQIAVRKKYYDKPVEDAIVMQKVVSAGTEMTVD